MIKLIAIDLDGTLLKSNHQIDQEQLDYIQQLTKQGIKIVIATGRPDQMVKPFANQLQLDTPFIMYNGGVIRNIQTDETLLENELDKEVALQVSSLCEKLDTAYLIYTKHTIYYKDCDRVTYLKKLNKELDIKEQCHFVYNHDYESIIQKEKINKILVIEPNEHKYNKLDNVIRNIKNTTIYQSQSSYIDVNPYGISKGKALELVAKHYNIKKEETMAIGDQENDASMILYAQIGVAMKDATQKAKEVADFITDSNDNLGVKKAITRALKETV